MDDNFFIMLGLLAALSLLLGPIGFFLALGARRRLKAVEAQLAPLLNRNLGFDAQPTPVAAPANAPQAAVSPPAAEAPDSAPAILEEAWAPELRAEQAAAENAGGVAAPLPSQPAAPRGMGLEEKLGARWAVVVGGIALALGALLLVKYSIDQGLFGPGLRVLSGLALGAALIAAGEFLRRRETSAEARSATPVSAVLTGAGAVAGFGALYAAHALYGFIGPGVAFALMGAMGVVTMLAAALHGPGLAALGLIGALGAPLLVVSADPDPWPVVPYVALVAAAAYGLARLRNWLWLAISVAVGAAVWQGLLVSGDGGAVSIDFDLAALVHLVVQGAMAVAIFAVSPNLRIAPAAQRTDKIGSLAMLATAGVAAATLAALSLRSGVGPAWIVAAALVAAMLALSGAFLPAVAAASAGAGALVLAVLASWDSNSGFVVDPYAFLASWPVERGMAPFVGFGLIAALALAALCFWRLAEPAPLSPARRPFTQAPAR